METVGTYLEVFDDDITGEGNQILWKKVKEKFADTSFPIKNYLVKYTINQICIQLTGESMEEEYYPSFSDYYINGELWNNLIPSIEANIDAENIKLLPKEEFFVHFAKKDIRIYDLTIPKGALYGKFQNHIFVLTDYNQFRKKEKTYWVLIYSLAFDYEWECYYPSESGIMCAIMDYIRKHNLSKQIVHLQKDIADVMKEDRNRGKRSRQEDVKGDYFKRRWFIRT
ncbi:MAG: hypothetical protein MR487_12885 [Lachnospiraceae bacterium]|nr:hypothetical protein [Lachnospiraceae bacterium]